MKTSISQKNVSYGIIILAFLFIRLPFFIWTPYPYITADPYEYYQLVEKLLHGEFPSFSVLPGGYVIFLYLLHIIQDSLHFVLVVQASLTLVTALFLQYVINKTFPKATIWVAILMALHLMEGHLLMFDHLINPDPLYRNSLVFFVAILILAVKTNKLQWWIILSISFILPAIIRSNGPFIYYLFILLLLYQIYKRFSLKNVLALTIPFVLLNLLWATYNYKTDNTFMISNPERINRVLTRISTDNAEKKATKDEKRGYLKRKAFFFSEMFNHAAGEWNFYVNIQNRCNEINKWAQKKGTVSKNIAIPIHLDEKLHELTLKEYYRKENPCQTKYDFSADIFYKHKSKLWKYKTYLKNTNLWFVLIQAYVSVKKYIINKYLISAAFILSILGLLWGIVKRKNTKDRLLIISVLSIHLFSLLSITLAHGYSAASGSYMRYAEGTDFILFAILPIYFCNYFRKDIKTISGKFIYITKRKEK